MSKMVPYRALRSTSPFGIFTDPFFRPFFEMDEFIKSAAFKVDLKDKGNHYELDAELPGVPQEQIELSVDGDTLTISANVDSEQKEEKENYIYSERRTGHMQRSFNLNGIDASGITADYKHGVLKVKLPKEAQEEKNTRRLIDIN